MVFLVQKNGRGKAQVYSAAWSPFGDVILTACGDDRIRVFRPEVRSEKFDNSGWMWWSEVDVCKDTGDGLEIQRKKRDV